MAQEELESVLLIINRHLGSINRIEWKDIFPENIVGLPANIRHACEIVKNQAIRNEIITESQMSTSQMSSILPFNDSNTRCQ